MPEQALLDLAGTDPVARRLDDVVGAALEPEVAILVAPRQVAGAQPGAAELGGRRVRPAPVFEQEGRVGAPDHDLAHLAVGD